MSSGEGVLGRKRTPFPISNVWRKVFNRLMYSYNAGESHTTTDGDQTEFIRYIYSSLPLILHFNHFYS